LPVVRDKAVFVDKVDPSKGPADGAVVKSETIAADPSQTVRGRIVDNQGNPVRTLAVRRDAQQTD
jgi:hypothetical protein